MLTIIILLLLCMGIYAGVRRGLVLQLVHTAGYIISFYFAQQYYLQLAEYLEMLVPYAQPGIDDQMVFYDAIQVLNLDVAFYNGISFLLIIFVGWLATRIIGYMLNSLTFLPVVKQLNDIGGGLLGFLMQYLGIFLLLYILTMIPFEAVQQLLADSNLARWMIANTPYLSSTISDLWLGLVGQL